MDTILIYAVSFSIRKHEKFGAVHKVLPYMLLNGGVCVALLLLAYFSVSNSIIAVRDYNPTYS